MNNKNKTLKIVLLSIIVIAIIIGVIFIIIINNKKNTIEIKNDDGEIVEPVEIKEDEIKENEELNEKVEEGHNYLKYIVSEATCTKEGKIIYICSDCGDRIEVSVDKKDHVLVTDEAIEPTCKSKGKTVGSHCKICGQTIMAQIVLNEVDHKYNDEGYCIWCNTKKEIDNEQPENNDPPMGDNTLPLMPLTNQEND